MRELYSQIKKGRLLHVIHRLEEFGRQRNDLSPEKEYMQATALCFPSGRVIEAHKHLLQRRKNNITQEAIVVISGLLKATFYDLNNQILEETSLRAGDCCITFHGGHRFESMEQNTSVYEFKNGPYNGKEKDKEFF